MNKYDQLVAEEAALEVLLDEFASNMLDQPKKCLHIILTLIKAQPRASWIEITNQVNNLLRVSYGAFYETE